jgi:enterochelin esterase family protein
LHSVVAELGGTPLGDDGRLTMLYLGAGDGVALRHWLDIFPPLPAFTRFEDTDLWTASIDIPDDARFDYKLAVRSHGRQRLKLDMLNPQRAPNPWGFNSELRGSAYAPPAWTQLRDEVPRVRVSRHEVNSAIFGEARAVHLYQPAGGRADSLLAVHDGDDYLEFARFSTVLDNLIDAGDIPPVAAVLCGPVDRLGEYRASSSHAAFIVDEVLPRARAEAGTNSAIAMGASLGGVASLHAAWSRPGVFDGLILQAGSFVGKLGGPFRRGPVFGPVVRFMRNFHDRPGALPNRVHVSCGRYDGLVNEARSMAEMLAQRGIEVGFAESAAGHDWRAWRDLLRPALVHVLGSEEA